MSMRATLPSRVRIVSTFARKPSAVPVSWCSVVASGGDAAGSFRRATFPPLTKPNIARLL
jgi:hypothetical protein